MRRVVTGEQVAQIYNPDPFARPVFRAPVYQTPAGLILLAWLARLLIWIIRLVVRHPAAALAVAVLVVPVGHRHLGRHGRHARVGHGGPAGLAVLLAVRVHPVGSGPGPGQVAGLDLPAQVGRGDDHRRPGPRLPAPGSSCPSSAK